MLSTSFTVLSPASLMPQLLFVPPAVYMMRVFGYCISYSFTSAVISDTLVIQIIAISDCSGEADGHHGQAEAGQSAQNGAADLTEK